MADWFDEGRRGGAKVDVQALLDSEGGAGLLECVGLGALVSMGLTGDGGALGVTITVDGRWRREYFRSPDELAEWVSEALPAVKLACEEVTASSGARTRSRSRRDR